MAIDPQDRLAGISLLRELPQTVRHELEQRCRWRSIVAQQQIIDRQSTSKDVYFVVEGSVRVVNYSLSGREITFDDIVAGGHFGEMSAIDGEPRSATIEALENTTVAILSAEAFIAVLQENPDLALTLMVRMSAIIRRATERIMDLSTLGANNRVYAEILRLAKDDVRDNNTAVIRPIPIHGDIASRVSTTRETVARVFGELSRRDLVRRESNALRILDMDRLTEMVEQFQIE
jgi:CRP-like cAMP-binding protein